MVVGLDETIERRWGARIKARGIYRDPVRSSHGHFVKASGLRWISLMLLAPVPFAGRVWALPFLTALAPSERYAAAQGSRHKQLTEWARQVLLLLARSGCRAGRSSRSPIRATPPSTCSRRWAVT
ncbi:MAG: transposase [Methylobacterium sp.]|uniref:transposase n=1 Tax=Methylobacterium sp. TaxID=409 RepID=UPI0025869929|nr:transposase [Methylobacterium sp.]MBY0296678.1 transposase [Methylobacterium sp.]